jgi:uncharacterized membrane protein
MICWVPEIAPRGNNRLANYSVCLLAIPKGNGWFQGLIPSGSFFGMGSDRHQRKLEAMKSILKFLKTTILGGLLFLVPIVVLAFILSKALELTRDLLVPLVARIPFESVIGLRTPMFLAIGVIVLISFSAGLIARRVRAQKIVGGLEALVLSKIPGYQILKGMGTDMLGSEDREAYPVVLTRFDDGWQLGLKVEELENGLVAVFVPDAPSPHSGSVYFMAPDRVVPAGIPISSMLKCLKSFGAGSNTVLRGVSEEMWPAK